MQLPSLTNKHQEIIKHIYRFRFLNRVQIQTLINSNDYGNTNKLLKYLVENKYLERIYETTIEKRTTPAKYFMGINGIRYLKTQDYAEKAYITNLYREKNKKEPFINRCLFIAEIYLKSRNQDDPLINEFIAPHDFPADETTKHLRPDFGYIQNLKTKQEYTIAKIIQDGMPRFAIRAVIQKYIDFFKDKADTRLLFTCQTYKQYKYLEYVIPYYREEVEDDQEITLPVYLAQENDLQKDGITKKVVKKVH